MNLLTNFNKLSLGIIILVIIATLSGSAIVPLWGDFLTSIGGNLESAGIAVAIVNISTAIFTAIMAVFETKYSKYINRFTILGFLILALAYFSYIFVRSVPELYITLLFISLANGMLWPAFNTIYQTTFNEDSGAVFWAIFNLSFDIGSGIGAFIGSHTVSSYGFTILFLILSVVCALGFICSVILLTRSQQIKTVN